jgi:hypothetical protein
MPELFEIPGPGGDGRRKHVLDELFRAQLAVEGWERRRRFCGRLVIILSAPLAFCVWRDVGLVEWPARLAFLLWAFSFTAWGVSVAGSLVMAREMDRLVERAGGRRVAMDGGEGE